MFNQLSAEQQFLRRYALSGLYRRQLKKIQAESAANQQTHLQVTMLNGMSIQVNPQEFIGKRVIRHGTYAFEDIFLIEQIARKLDKTKVILDVGANIGNHSLCFSSCFEQVMAFEPNPQFVQALQHNIALNHLSNVQVCAVGLSTVDDQLPYHYATVDNPGASGFVVDEQQADCMLQVRNGDQLLADLGVSTVSAIKCDVEGHEAQVLAGLQQTIARDRPLILFEYVPEHMAARGGFAAVKAMLPGYEIFMPKFAHKQKPLGRLLGPIRGLQFTLQRLTEIPNDHSDLMALCADDVKRLQL